MFLRSSSSSDQFMPSKLLVPRYWPTYSICGNWRLPTLRSRLNFDVSGDTCWMRNRLAKLSQRFQVPFDGFPDVPFRFFEGAARCNTAWEIWNICRPVALGLFKNDCVSDAHYFFSNPAAFGSTSACQRERHHLGAPVWSRRWASRGACSGGGFQWCERAANHLIPQTSSNLEPSLLPIVEPLKSGFVSKQRAEKRRYR